MSLPHDLRHLDARGFWRRLADEHAPELIICGLILALILDRAGIWK